MAIDAQHPEYKSHFETWKKIDDITRGKNLRDYLPDLNPHDKSIQNKKRNEQYFRRSVFYGVSGQTVNGFLGLMFSKWPEFEVPAQIDYLSGNVDGSGISIYQQSQAVADDVIRMSRAGLVVSYPRTEGAVSRQDILDNLSVATIHHVEPKSIINWRTIQRGAQSVLSLVVIKEMVPEISDDGYSIEMIDQIREMYLDDGVYSERLWRKVDGEYQPFDEYTPTDASGSTFEIIPFTFVGSENNAANVDTPNMERLVDINLGHFRNSADWEESIFYAGQAQPYMSGVSQIEFDRMQEQKIYVGSRSPIILPEGGQFGFASAEPNSVVRQAMIDKVELMVGLGAIMLQPNGPAKTATQAAGEIQSQHSVLTMIAKNVSEAYTTALSWVMRYMGVDGEAYYEINQDFIRPETSPQELQAIMQGYIQGSVPLSEYISYMRHRGFFDAEKPEDELIEDLGQVDTEL